MIYKATVNLRAIQILLGHTFLATEVGCARYPGAMDRRAAILCCLLVATSWGCSDFPRDAENTLREVQAGRPLMVGWSAAAPWVQRAGSGEPAGIEADILRNWAVRRGVRLQWVEAGETQIVEALNGNRLDIGIAGFTDQAPHGGLIGQTQPYMKVKVVIGARPGAKVPGSWKGIRVSYDRSRPEFAALLHAEEAFPTTATSSYRLVYEPELGSLGLRSTGKTLQTQRRTIATPPSENALTLALDQFLHANKGAIEARLAQESRR